MMRRPMPVKMMLRRALFTVAFAGAILAGAGLSAIAPAMAMQPDEVLADKALERRARDISLGLRCLVCQNQSIDDSDADVARDLRRVVRQRLTAGDSDAQVRDYVVARYGDFVLLKPPVNARTLLLWGGPALVLLCGVLLVMVSRRQMSRDAEPLDEAEKEALEQALRKDDAAT